MTFKTHIRTCVGTDAITLFKTEFRLRFGTRFNNDSAGFVAGD